LHRDGAVSGALPLQSQWWGICPRPLPPPNTPPTPSLPSVCLLSLVLQRTALELEWPEQDRQLPGPGAHREKERRGAWGGSPNLMRCTVSMATLSEEGKKKRVGGHHRASEWVSVATVAMAVERPLLVTLSKQIKGHTIRRGQTLGPIQQCGPKAYNTWAQTEKDREKGKRKKSVGPSVS
ncbi:CAP-Gly domain containing linker protein 4, partial [Dissostichus eleginoides]